MVVLDRGGAKAHFGHCPGHQSSRRKGMFNALALQRHAQSLKAIINFGTESYAGRHFHTNPVPSIGRGIGLVIGLLIMQVCASLGVHHFFYRGASTGVLVRGGLITAIYSRSLRLTSRARSSLTNGKLVNHISTDVSRIDFCAGFFHMVRRPFVDLQEPH